MSVIGDPIAAFEALPPAAQAVSVGFVSAFLLLAAGLAFAPRRRRARDEPALADHPEPPAPPKDPLPPHGTSAHAALDRGDVAHAHALALRDLADAGDDEDAIVLAYLTLADVAVRRGDVGDALTHALEAERRLSGRLDDDAPLLIAAHARQARALTLTDKAVEARRDLETLRDRLLALDEPRMADDVDHWIAEAVVARRAER